jgi:hypothetical protein
MQWIHERLSAHEYLWLGLLALLLSAGLAALSFVVYGKEMGPHIFATIIGILGEAALVVLVLDRMSSSQRRREWRFVGTVVSHGVAACMVDLVRLYVIRWSSRAYRVNSARYDEFVQMLRLHLANLQSNLEGLALGAQPSAYEQARQIERRIAWLANYLNNKPVSAARPQQWELESIISTTKLAGEFMRATVAAEFTGNLMKARDATAGLDEIESPEKSDAAADKFLSMRLRSQSNLLERDPSLRPEVLRGYPNGGFGIWYDLDQKLAPFYFAIDFMLFSCISGGTVS